jgi:hypothetical protein
LGNLPDYWKYKAATGRTIGEFLVEKRFEYGPIFIVFFMQRAIVFLGSFWGILAICDMFL